MANYDRLSVGGGQSSRGGIADMSDGYFSFGQFCEILRIKDLVYQSKAFVIAKHATVVHYYAAAFLTSVL